MLPDSQLRSWTKNWWWKSAGKDPNWNYYLGPLDQNMPINQPDEPLLFKELAWAKSRGRVPLIASGQKITLAFLVGDSFDPILQSILAYQPDRLVPVVCNFYGSRDPTKDDHIVGLDQWKKLKALIVRLPNNEKTGKPFEVQDHPQTVPDTPSGVFAYLKDQLSGEAQASDQWDVWVDITGAKKTMVAGAFLYAAYTGTRICYVDFDEYDQESHRPYGFTCWFREVDNIYQRLHLREWEQVQTLYTRYDFHSALTVLEAGLNAPDTWNENYQNMLVFFRLCHEWEEGHYRAALEILDTLPDEVKRLAPTAIALLGPKWPARLDGPAKVGCIDAFLLDPPALIIYAKD